MAGAGLWSATSLPAEEHVVHHASDPTGIPAMIMAYEGEPTDDSGYTEHDYSPVEHPSNLDYTPSDHSSPEPSEPVHLPDHTSVGLQLLNSDYETNEEEEDISTSLEITSPRPNPSHRSFRAHLTGTQVKQTLSKTIVIPSRKGAASPQKTKKPCGDYI
ncbi:unnamed protein product [Lactuca saligna]|uniref:Uncharacterized protein n=1 Tax=Lactuca saligna TaxID=75948 RepID=A0AA35YBQ1_LACSI|nr:unnamed protein product [Lactuca saligna]